MEKINVLSLLKVDHSNYKRPVYNKSWVDKLYRSVQRHLHVPFEFICFTNDIKQTEVNYTILPLQFDEWGWWNKFEMFKKELFCDPCLYLDIDNLICRDITEDIKNIKCTDKLLLPKEPYKNILNCSLMYWNTDLSFLYDDYCNNRQNFIPKYQYATLEQPATGDQGYLADNYSDVISNFDNYVSNGFVQWKHHKVSTDINNPAILAFTSTEKPTNNLHLDIVKNNWI